MLGVPPQSIDTAAPGKPSTPDGITGISLPATLFARADDVVENSAAPPSAVTLFAAGTLRVGV